LLPELGDAIGNALAQSEREESDARAALSSRTCKQTTFNCVHIFGYTIDNLIHCVTFLYLGGGFGLGDAYTCVSASIQANAVGCAQPVSDPAGIPCPLPRFNASLPGTLLP